MRQAIRSNDRKEQEKYFYSKNKCKVKYFPEWKKKLKRNMNAFRRIRCYSLHCGELFIILLVYLMILD